MIAVIVNQDRDDFEEFSGELYTTPYILNGKMNGVSLFMKTSLRPENFYLGYFDSVEEAIEEISKITSYDGDAYAVSGYPEWDEFNEIIEGWLESEDAEKYQLTKADVILLEHMSEKLEAILETRGEAEEVNVHFTAIEDAEDYVLTESDLELLNRMVEKIKIAIEADETFDCDFDYIEDEEDNDDEEDC